MINCRLPAILIFLLSASLAAAQSLPDGMTMHRKAAGTIDSSGWTNAESTKGRFAVRLPLQFNDFTMQMPETEANVATTFVVGAKSSEGIKFAAQRIVYRKKEAAPHFFARLRAGAGFRSRPESVITHQFHGRPSVDLLVQQGDVTGHMRYVLMDDSLVFLVVEVPNKSRSLVPIQLVRSFFDSLRVSPLERVKVGSSG